MGTSQEAIERVVAAFERSDWTEIDVRFGDVRVHLATGTTTRTPSGSPPDTTAAGASEVAGDDTTERSLEPEATVALPPGAHVVVAPSPGIFWRSPEPGAPPFADVGDTVDPSTTVCIIEVMKLMSHLKAGVGGEVVAVFVDNGVAVQKGAPLFAISLPGAVTTP